MTTIIDVARRAEVSVPTVSRVINDHPTVRPKTRRAVLQAMAELGYLPNSTARSLRKSRSETVGFVVANLRNPVSLDTLEGIDHVVRARGFSLLLCDSHGDRALQSAHLRRLFEKRVDVLILNPVGDSCPEAELYARAHIPAVVLDTEETSFGWPRIHVNLKLGFQSAITYLAGLGHQRIGHIFTGFPGLDARAEEHRQTMTRLGLEHDPSLLISAASGKETSDAVASLLSRSDRPTALISYRLALTPFVLTGVDRANLRIPDEVSVITAGDSPWTLAYHPALTAVTFDRRAWGKAAAEYVMARLDGKDAEHLLRETQARLITRSSCAPVTREAVQAGYRPC